MPVSKEVTEEFFGSPAGSAATLALLVCAAVGMNTIGWHIIRKVRG